MTICLIEKSPDYKNYHKNFLEKQDEHDPDISIIFSRILIELMENKNQCPSLLKVDSYLKELSYNANLAKSKKNVAQRNLGVFYRTKYDYQMAVIWFRKAAERGDAQAQHNLRVLYSNSEGVDKNPPLGLGIWTKKETVAEQGFAHAQYNLGVIYQYGEPAEQRFAPAENNLEMMRSAYRRTWIDGWNKVFASSK